MRQHDICITGYSLLCALGEDADAAWTAIETGPPGERCRWDRFAPFGYFPLASFDAERRIPSKDIRYMQQSMLSGVYAAGLALESAGLKGDAELLRRTDLIVAACEGERDEALDRAIHEARRSAEAPEEVLNEMLVRDLRPSLFLAQLPNLFAANIGIVEGVGGSSLTLIGEESAGFHAVRLGCQRIRWGRSDVVLVGGVSSAEKLDLQIGFGSAARLRTEEGGEELALGSAAGFVVLESVDHARSRGVPILASISGCRQLGALPQGEDERTNIDALLEASLPSIDTEPIWLVSGSNRPALARTERRWGEKRFGPKMHYRDTTSHTGALLEACLPANLALGAACLRRHSSRVLVSCQGHDYGQAGVLLESARGPSAGRAQRVPERERWGWGPSALMEEAKASTL
jgi:3-oxoacyl-[acyl-carrier-protein] synthase II